MSGKADKQIVDAEIILDLVEFIHVQVDGSVRRIILIGMNRTDETFVQLFFKFFVVFARPVELDEIVFDILIKVVSQIGHGILQTVAALADGGISIVNPCLPWELQTRLAEVAIGDGQCAKDEVASIFIAGSVSLECDRAVVFSVQYAEGDRAVDRFLFDGCDPLLFVQNYFQLGRIEVGSADPNSAIRAVFVGNGRDAAVTGVAYQNRPQNPVTSVPSVVEEVALSKVECIRRTELQPLQDLRAGLETRLSPSLEDPADEATSLVGER
ncbi:hypothetical protein C4588_04095 [Candidatus Parcubacteria bacterium]|nr:MAG: hypothetical protein C4588_04095 [Candidatus Parcubacteria bacterium]